jgi:hypothetical protein
MDPITFSLAVLFLALAGTALIVVTLLAIDCVIAAIRAPRQPDRRVHCEPEIHDDDVVTRLRVRGQA